MRNWIVSIVLVVLAVIFGLLTYVWANFLYFSVTLLALLALYWTVELILDYVFEYKTCFQEKFDLYKAKIVNTTSYTSDDIEKGQSSFKKRFKRTLLRDKTVDLLKIFIALGIFIALISWLFSKLI